MKKREIIIPIVIVVTAIFLVFLINKYRKIVLLNKKNLEQKVVANIKKHYGDNVITLKNTKIYKKENNKYIENGSISKNVTITLKELNEDKFDEYFYIPSLDSYIYFDDVKITENKIENDRYKNYIYFNKNIKTKNKTNFYDINNNLLYTLNKSFDFKVLVMDDDKYGIVFNDELLFIKKEDVEQLYDSNNNESNREKIKTLYYHFIYNPETSKCDQIICHTLSQFESHLKYLSENNYFTLTMDELEMYLDGKINIPQKSIVLTIDDATIFDLESIKLLEKYKINATMFVITDWVNIEPLKSPYLDLESHSNNMHKQYECEGMGSQGGGILCLSKEEILSDLKLSQEKLGGSKYFSYPFFDYNDRAIELLKDAGFSMAFIGPVQNGDSYKGKTDKFKIPRLGIFSYTTLEQFISYLQ